MRATSSNIMKNNWKNPCFREKMHNLLCGVPRTDEVKRKCRESNKARWQDPEFRNNRIKIIKKTSESYWTDERREQARINNTGEKNLMYGKHLKESTCSKMSESANYHGQMNVKAYILNHSLVVITHFMANIIQKNLRKR